MHYKFTGQTKVVFGVTLKQIVSIKNLSTGVIKGTVGGYIEKETNLSGDAWVFGNARVSGDARVSGNARVFGNARVSGNARVFGDARVSGDAWVSGNARVFGDAWVSGDARVFGNARVFGDAWVFGDAHIDSITAIIVLVIAMKWSVTITKNLIFIGCTSFKAKEALKLTKKQAKELGLEEKYYQAYKDMIKGALKIIK